MDAAIQKPLCSQELQILQKCRLYLGATTLSDICTAHGSRIDEDIWNGRRSRSTSSSRIPALSPSQDEWVVWQSILMKLFLQPHTQTRRLRQPMGPWHTPTDTQWSWYRDPAADTVFEHFQTVWYYGFLFNCLFSRPKKNSNLLKKFFGCTDALRSTNYHHRRQHFASTAATNNTSVSTKSFRITTSLSYF